jgi:D-glycero-D-manno-heptose 1,7-bisphosphate phosphatase
VVNENRANHVKKWDEFKFLPGSVSSLRKLRESGLKLALVTNQANIGRGVMTRTTIENIHANMQAVLTENSAQFDTIQYCPHKPESNCSCRKPKPGLASAAIAELQIDPDQTCIIGDTYGDAVSGLVAGCSFAILVPSTRNPGDPDELPQKYRDKLIKYPSFAKATDAILQSSGSDN